MAEPIEIIKKTKIDFSTNSNYIITKHIECFYKPLGMDNYLRLLSMEKAGEVCVNLYEKFNGENKDEIERFEGNGSPANKKAGDYCKKAEAEFLTKQKEYLKDRGLESKIVINPTSINGIIKEESNNTRSVDEKLDNLNKFISDNFSKK